MGKRGPAPKPAALKDMEGTRRKDREATNMPEPEPGVPDLPDGWGEDALWGEEAVREYYRITPTLKTLGLLAKIDRAGLLAYCDSWARWVYYRAEVQESGDTFTTQKGFVAQHPNMQLMNRASDDMKKYLALFGLSPSDRTRVTASPSKADTDPAEGFFDGPKLAD